MTRRMIEVFSTNVNSTENAGRLQALLASVFHLSAISFDLEDCDRVLRIEAAFIEPTRITSLLYEQGFECCVME